MRWLERLRSLEEKSAFLENATVKTAKSLSYSFCSTSSQECEISHAAFGQAGVVTSAPLDPGPLLPPPEWIKGVSLLAAMARPARLRAERWQQVVADAGRFLRDWT